MYEKVLENSETDLAINFCSSGTYCILWAVPFRMSSVCNMRQT